MAPSDLRFRKLPRFSPPVSPSLPAFALVAAALASFPSAARAEPPVARVTTQNLVSSPHAFASAKSSGKAGLAVLRHGTVTTRIHFRKAARVMVLRSGGTYCGGSWPAVTIKVDGRVVGRRAIRGSGLKNYAFRVKIKSGDHRVSITPTQTLSSAKCDRDVYADILSFFQHWFPSSGSSGGGADPAPAPDPDPIPAPATTPIPVTPGAAGAVRWAPPALTNPTTVVLGTGDTSTTLDNAKDYILKMPAGIKGATQIMGGRNVVLIGGEIHVPAGSSQSRALFIKNNVGTFHIEGLVIDNTGSREADGIAINAPLSTVQIENTRVIGITGSQSGIHGDVVQPWGGVKALRIDHLSGHSNYQGLFLRPDRGAIGAIDVSNVDLSYDNVGKAEGGYLFWLTTGACSTAGTIALSEVYLKKLKPGKSLGTSVWPETKAKSCASSLTTIGGLAMASWAALPVSGGVKAGSPSVGEFVPAGAAGTTYAPKGYTG